MANGSRWVAYQISSGDQRDIFVQPFPPTGAIYQITKGGRRRSDGTQEAGHHPFWSRDERELYYIPDGSRLAFVAIRTSPTFTEVAETEQTPFQFLTTARSVSYSPLSMIANASRNSASVMHSGGLVKKVFQRTNV